MYTQHSAIYQSLQLTKTQLKHASKAEITATHNISRLQAFMP